MGTLTFRAEQALLGAMLQRPSLPSALHYLDAGDFTAIRHRQVFSAIMEASAAVATDGDGRSWKDLVAEAAGPEIEPPYLAELVRACPDPSHGPVYGRLVVEASVRRTLAADADDLDSQAGAIGYSARRLFTAQVDGGRQVEVSAEYAKEVAGLLRRHATAFSPDTATALPGPLAAVSDRRGRTEERVLAALFQRHADTREILGMLPPEAFTDPSRREIYQTLRAMHLSGRSHEVDGLTVDWEAVLARGPVPSFRASGMGADDEPSYATRLAAVTVTGPATRLARDLVRPSRESRNERTLSPPAPAHNGAAPAVRLVQPPPPQPGNGSGPVQGR